LVLSSSDEEGAARGNEGKGGIGEKQGNGEKLEDRIVDESSN
jgi:hypothetical protein